MTGRTLYVASTGGHLDELVHLAGRFTPAPSSAEWVTFASEQTTELLAGETVHLVRPVEPKDIKGALAAVPAAVRLLKRGRFTQVVSTGAAVAVPYALAARLLGVRFHYVESSARSEGPSLTGRMLARLPGVRLYTQYPAWAGKKWQFRGSVLDGFTGAAPVAVPERLRKVVVIFGTQSGFPFTRAAEALAKALPEVTAPDAEVLWQTGSTDVSHLGIDGQRLLPPAVLRAAVAEADLVIAHAGVGSALMVLEQGRCPLLIPRRATHGEHTDDHQLLIARELQRRGLAVALDADVVTGEDLLRAAALRASTRSEPAPFPL
jgi:UDP-N-acetylglucosamine--N-acetylmuramyl-(pentapeptide) pyrophosphoryl-undecaprenol N-acetylglucosamine transferase